MNSFWKKDKLKRCTISSWKIKSWNRLSWAWHEIFSKGIYYLWTAGAINNRDSIRRPTGPQWISSLWSRPTAVEFFCRWSDGPQVRFLIDFLLAAAHRRIRINCCCQDEIDGQEISGGRNQGSFILVPHQENDHGRLFYSFQHLWAPMISILFMRDQVIFSLSGPNFSSFLIASFVCFLFYSW